MQDQWTIERLGDLHGSPVYDSAGEKIGKVDEIYYDMETERPEWISLGTGFFGSKRLLVPVTGASARDDGIAVPYTKAQVEDSPQLDSDEIEPGVESSLYSYYAADNYATDTSTRQVETAGAGAPAADEGSITRKEEELKVGTRPVEAGRVRLRKWVETEPVSADVELTRERAHVERERIDEPVSGHDFQEEEIEIPLHGEEPVVEKQAVAKERISVGKHAEAETQTVTDTLRKERVEVDKDGVENVDEVD